MKNEDICQLIFQVMGIAQDYKLSIELECHLHDLLMPILENPNITKKRIPTKNILILIVDLGQLIKNYEGKDSLFTKLAQVFIEFFKNSEVQNVSIDHKTQTSQV